MNWRWKTKSCDAIRSLGLLVAIFVFHLSASAAEAAMPSSVDVYWLSTKAISDKQLDSIIAYVNASKRPADRGGWGIGHIGPVPEGMVAWFLAGLVLVAMCMLLGKRLSS